MPHDIKTNENPVRWLPVDTSSELYIDHFAFMRSVIEGCEMTVLTKRSKERIVQVPDDAIKKLKSYLASRGLDPDPEVLSNRST